MNTALRRPRVLLPLLIVVLIAALSLLPAPARAHDTLISSDPADGAAVETSPEQITLTYSADLLEVSPVVRIVDADGETVLEETPTIDGPTAVLDLAEPLPAGEYEIQWRVVSSDGHPIEGTLALTVENDPAAGDLEPAGEETAGEKTTAPAASDAGSDAPTSAETTSEATAAEEQQGSGGLPAPLLIGIGVVIVIAAGVGVALATRKKS
ncbi:copper resistance CopC family protein [Brachybacterium sp. J153]|uniref:copper resistance CopC family protein n=1 Tax=Brachybacterium sp. J153 TaxID=3116488 RepID=UPI002E773B74|nr:copper resistance CopC family protein [Brachybacterium sp. J153]MEE1618135.1 copper resistance CopC family protein [Brachybacterium sp. J153]